MYAYILRHIGTFAQPDTIYRVSKMHRMPYLYRSLSAKEPYNSWLLCGEKPATKGMLCIFATLYFIPGFSHVCTYVCAYMYIYICI